MPPLVILRGTEPGVWTLTDRILAVADMQAQDMRCSGCGMPKIEAFNPDSEGWYEHREATCNGCASLRHAAESDREYHPERKLWVQDVRPPSVELKPWTPPGVSVAAAGSG